MDNVIIDAFQMAFSFQTVLAVGCGVLFGTIIGALPGLGTMLGVAVCLPFTFSMESAAAIGLLLSVMCSSIYGGSISAVLLNTPGTPNSVATGLDGYAMARLGKAEEALGWVTASSVFGGLFSCGILILLAPKIAMVSAKYGTPLVICALIIMGISCITSLDVKNQIRGLMMGVLGFFMATIGVDFVSGETRFTFGINALESGIDMLPVCVGLYPVAEVLYRIYELVTKKEAQPIECTKIQFPKLNMWKGRIINLFRSSTIGTFIGILPGAGSVPATFMSYTTAKKFSKNGDNFTKGEPDGLVAAESANNAVTGGALVPTLALGVPGDSVTALMLFTFTIHDITPGVFLMRDNPQVIYAVFITLIMANLFIFFASIPTVKFFGRLISIPAPLLLGLIISFSMLGVYVYRGNFIDLPITIIIGLMAFVCRLREFPVAPILIAYILGPQLEYRLSQVLIYKGNSSWPEYLITQPFAMILLLIAAFLLFSPICKSIVSNIKDMKKETVQKPTA